MKSSFEVGDKVVIINRYFVETLCDFAGVSYGTIKLPLFAEVLSSNLRTDVLRIQAKVNYSAFVCHVDRASVAPAVFAEDEIELVRL